jgi:hypothetical protein
VTLIGAASFAIATFAPKESASVVAKVIGDRVSFFIFNSLILKVLFLHLLRVHSSYQLTGRNIYFF